MAVWKGGTRSALLGALGLLVAVTGLVALLGAGPGARAGLWHWRTGFDLLRWAAYLGLAGAFLSLLVLVARPWLRPRAAWWVPALGLLLGALAAAIPWRVAERARAFPVIADVTTDPDDPPVFVALVPARQASPNGAAYGGPAVAARQRAAYPDIRPLVLRLPPARAFEAVQAAAADLGWTIVAVDRFAGRLEATTRTFWFGFTDDVVVRVRPEGSGSRVDVRSASRVGRGDAGANARRVRAFLGEVEGRAGRPEPSRRQVPSKSRREGV